MAKLYMNLKIIYEKNDQKNKEKRCNRRDTRILWKSFISWESILYSCLWMAHLIINYTNTMFTEKKWHKIKAAWLVSKVFLYKIFAFAVKSIAFETHSLHSHMRTHIICQMPAIKCEGDASALKILQTIFQLCKIVNCFNIECNKQLVFIVSTDVR